MEREDRDVPEARPGSASWGVCGLAGGIAAGLLDAALTLSRGVGGLAPGRAASLFVVSASLVGAAGGLLGLAIGFGARLARASAVARIFGRRSAPKLAAFAAAPVLLFDAFALFQGRRAALLPARHLVALALFAMATFGVYLFVRVVMRALRAPGALMPALVAGALAVAALVSHHVDRTVLPRLYPWFHATLSAMTLLLAAVVARLVWKILGVLRGARPAPRPAARFTRLAVPAAALIAFGASLWMVRSSQVLRFASHERTRLTAATLGLLPFSLPPRTAAGVVRHRGERHLPPLPEGPRSPESDLIVITIDALRADHVGAYGYGRAITPHIDALARQGTRFERAYAQAPHTSFSVTSMLTGKYYPTLARLAPSEAHDPIAAVLRTYGWKTAAFYPPAVFFVDGAKLKAYADTNYNFEYVKLEYLDAERRVGQVIDYFREVRPRKAFVWVHFFEPHEPYETHPDFQLGAGDVDRYDSEIAYTDAAVGRLVDWLKENRPNAIIVLSADHGEEFDEHGGRYHGSTLYDEQLRIPLIMKVPGVAPRVVGGQVELIDVAPTALNLLDIPVPARMRGTDLGPWLASPAAPADRLPPAFAEVEDKRMVVYRQGKLICDLNWGYCAFHDLAADPGERRNSADEKPERAAELRALLDDWLDGHVRFEPHLARGVANPDGGPVPKPIERGRLGDLLAAPELAALLTDGVSPALVRREAAQLLVTLPARKETAAALARAVEDPDSEVADWASVGSVRLGDSRAQARVRRLVEDEGTGRLLRLRAALALGAAGDRTGVPVLSAGLDSCEEVLLCRLVILQLGKLRDARAVPALLKHLPEVQNRREMVDALGDIGDAGARDALVARLEGDEYVPVRVQAAAALAKIGDGSVIPALERAARRDTEPTVVAAARRALDLLKAQSTASASRDTGGSPRAPRTR